MTKRILITGGLGYIGSALLRNLDKNIVHEVIVLDNIESRRYPSLFGLPKGFKFKFIKDDILTADFDKYLSGVDVVVHLAALVDAELSYKLPQKTQRVNFGGLKRVANACLAHNIRLFFPSTTAVYASSDPLINEDCKKLEPQSPYAKSKLDCEKYLEKLGEKGLKFIICRFGTIYGHSIGINFVTAVNRFVWQAVNGESLTVWKTAWDQKRPYLYLGDAVRALNFIIKKNLFNGQIYNVVTENLTVKDIVGIIRKTLPNLKITYTESLNMNKLSYGANTEKFKSLGFTYSGKMETGIKESIDQLSGIAQIS